VLKLTQKGLDVLYGRENAKALKREEAATKSKGQRGSEPGQYDKTLFEKLRSLRKKLAEEHQVPPYIIFSDRTLHEMCKYFPATLPDMRGISGVGDAKLEGYGKDFVHEIKRYLSENPDIAIPKWQYADFIPPNGDCSKLKKKGETIEETYEFFQRGMSLEEIAQQRNLAPSTISQHLERLIQEGRDIDIDRLVDPAKRKEIEEFFLSLGQWALGPVIEHFNGAVSYEEARLVRALLLRGTRR
jgi:ATP-dependent DNA helicase RecQ